MEASHFNSDSPFRRALSCQTDLNKSNAIKNISNRQIDHKKCFRRISAKRNLNLGSKYRCGGLLRYEMLKDRAKKKLKTIKIIYEAIQKSAAMKNPIVVSNTRLRDTFLLKDDQKW